MVGFTANKIEAALHKCSTQLMMYQTVTDLCTTKYSSILRCGAEQFPVFWKCYNPLKQWKLLTHWCRIQLIMLACKHLLLNCTVYVWHVHILSTYKLMKLKSYGSDANIISWGWHSNVIHSSSFACRYYKNLFCNVHYTISQWQCYLYIYNLHVLCAPWGWLNMYIMYNMYISQKILE